MDTNPLDCDDWFWRITEILLGSEPSVRDSAFRICSRVLAIRCAWKSKPLGNRIRKWSVLICCHEMEVGLFSNTTWAQPHWLKESMINNKVILFIQNSIPNEIWNSLSWKTTISYGLISISLTCKALAWKNPNAPLVTFDLEFEGGWLNNPPSLFNKLCRSA